ncbi:hypothetical protein A1OO_15340 [Enterovibrio norvegicus FF-33]|uniref:hypothetical protein n=1 Tax=Enterovibrio norvegicus TaxID=188144 RepID=UPI0003010A2C|nr:hypothetical protein [Enterovibrio norvegicus]OEE67129.1 hypothetical protein A1OO_15340 [Enterovibrio norvegicus FF-33]
MRVTISALNDNDRVALWEKALDMSPPDRNLALLAAYLPKPSDEDVGEWTLAGRDHFLLLAYRCEFGENITVTSPCVSCDTKTQLSFRVSDVLATSSDRLKTACHLDSVNTEAYLPRYVSMNDDEFSCRFRLPTIGDLYLLASAHSPLSQLAQCVLAPESYNDVATAITQKDDPVSAWEGVYQTLEAQMLAIEPLTIVSLNASCPECKGETAHQFDIVSQFWALLAADVERQLWDVHILASAYGWSSHDILAMSPARRRQHIAMVIE